MSSNWKIDGAAELEAERTGSKVVQQSSHEMLELPLRLIVSHRILGNRLHQFRFMTSDCVFAGSDGRMISSCFLGG